MTALTAPPRPSLWRRWVAVTTAGELAGFAVPAVTAAAAVAAGLPDLAVLVLLVVAGAVEGSLLGWAQGIVLRRVLPGLAVRSWVTATAAGAAVAYVLGMTPSTLAPRLTDVPWPLLAAGAAVLGLALLASIGTAQWLVLRRHRPDARWWIWLTAAAWLVGLAVFMAVASPLWQSGQPLELTVGIGLLAGLLMAATVAAVTGRGVLHLAGAGR